MSSLSDYFASQPTLRRAPFRHEIVIHCSAYFQGLPTYTRSRGKAHQAGLRRRRNRTHRASRATLNTASNGAEAEGHREAQAKMSETSATSVSKQSAVQGVSESRAKVSDRLKAAVKQVDKQVHEVVAVPVPQNMALAPHMHEHPGESIASCPS